jgi:amidophosphoribosyltransferase
MPDQADRATSVMLKLNPLKSVIKDKRIVLVDDSIVRGTTSRKIVKMVRAAGATEVHMRISCPPTISPCFYGVDTPRRAELIAATHARGSAQRGADTSSLVGAVVRGGPDRNRRSCYTGDTRRSQEAPISSWR